jgi:hypothetical protein
MNTMARSRFGGTADGPTAWAGKEDEIMFERDALLARERRDELQAVAAAGRRRARNGVAGPSLAGRTRRAVGRRMMALGWAIAGVTDDYRAPGNGPSKSYEKAA